MEIIKFWNRRFRKKKLKCALLIVLAAAFIFVERQLFYVKEIDQTLIGKMIVGSLLRRGIRAQDLSKYRPNSRGMFVCFTSKSEIDFSKVNDDYCDCPLDGSDEPATNACNNGVFYCNTQSLRFPAQIPSYKVNDGYCDCCDRSDEWAKHANSDGTLYHLTECQRKC